MPGTVNAKLIWEDNPDTSLTATNLSKSIDIISDSKFIEYTDSTDDYESWADLSLQALPDPALSYVNKIIYIENSSSFVKGINNNGEYSWISSGFPTPINRLLKIKANTKIGMQYTTTSGVLKYQNFDVGGTHALFSQESLIGAEYFSPNLKYNIYLYNSIVLGDYSKIRIVSEYDDINNTGGWKQGEIDLNSPTGSKVISIRKIGGFKTNASADIDPNSLWDISTYRTEVITGKYKIINSNGVRNLSAEDIPISDTSNLFVSGNVEEALTDVKSSVMQFKKDIYNTSDRYGIELQYSIFTKQDSSIIPIDLNLGSLLLPLRITPGYINISGRRVNITDHIYLGDKSLQFKINNHPSVVTDIQLGALPSTDPYLSTTLNRSIYPGIWRVYIDSNGTIIFREGDQFIPRYLNDETRKGWYYASDNSRCIGKFIVRLDKIFYVEKMSITNTFELNAAKNSIHIFHGSMCPDGLFLCDGNWHDTNGITANTYTNMPSPTGAQWAQSWWDQTPNMLGKTIKMFDNGDFGPLSGSTIQRSVPQPKFAWTIDSDYAIISSGSSLSCGEEGGSDTHYHTMNHQHSVSSDLGADIRINNSFGAHNHEQTVTNIEISSNNDTAVLYSGPGSGQPLLVSPSTHKHEGSISYSGLHGHEKESFIGFTAQPDVTATAATNSWSPYKEFVICIKK